MCARRKQSVIFKIDRTMNYFLLAETDFFRLINEAAEVVKRIFAMTIDGYGPYQIASKLKEEKVLIPSAYLARHGEGVNKNKTFKDVYGWGSSTSATFLKSVNIWDTPSTSRPESTSRTRKAIMSRRTNGQFSRIPMKLSLTSRPLTLCRKSVGMSDATRTAGAKQLLDRKSVV